MLKASLSAKGGAFSGGAAASNDRRKELKPIGKRFWATTATVRLQYENGLVNRIFHYTTQMNTTRFECIDQVHERMPQLLRSIVVIAGCQ